MWQPIETAPKDGARIIGYASDMGVRFIHWQNYGDDYPAPVGWREGLRVYVDGCDDHPTHWMPLPERPELSGKEMK